jgi:hypothetical protein
MIEKQKNKKQSENDNTTNLSVMCCCANCKNWKLKTKKTGVLGVCKLTSFDAFFNDVCGSHILKIIKK